MYFVKVVNPVHRPLGADGGKGTAERIRDSLLLQSLPIFEVSLVGHFDKKLEVGNVMSRYGHKETPSTEHRQHIESTGCLSNEIG